MRRLPAIIALGTGLGIGALGLWAFVDPGSFYDRLAVFPPYNEHFLHDVGAFQMGIGATLVGAVFVKDALAVALGGAGIGALLHAVSHFLDRDLGGRSTDPWSLGLLGLVILAGALLRARDLSRT